MPSANGPSSESAMLVTTTTVIRLTLMELASIIGPYALSSHDGTRRRRWS